MANGLCLQFDYHRRGYLSKRRRKHSKIILQKYELYKIIYKKFCMMYFVNNIQENVQIESDRKKATVAMDIEYW
jgi:hypothetical protein